MNRRTLLRLGGASLAAAGLGTLGLGVAIQPRRIYRRPARADDATLPSQLPDGAPRRVAVVGGGLAGLTAAITLAERGFAVTLFEQASHLGGKVGGWTIRALGEDFPIEHGFHGFFAQYYNLRELLADAGALGDLVPSTGYPVLFADRPMERFGTTTSIFPLNLLSVITQSDTLRFKDFTEPSEGLLDLMRFDPAVTFEAFDGIDFATFAKERRIPASMVDTVLRPFGDTTLNRVERLSAAEALRFFHFYFMGNPEGLAFDYTRRDSMTAIVLPLAERLRALGGTIRTSTRVRRIDAEGKKVTGVVVEAGAAAADTLSLPATDVPATGWAEVRDATGAPVFVSRTESGLTALDGRCTHKGCPVGLDTATGGFRCPCHGGTFDRRGAVTGGPPPRALDVLAATEADGVVTVTRPGSPEESVPADWCVVACEVRGLKKLMAASQYLGSSALAVQVASLGESEPYVVLRVWLDRPVRAERDAFYTTSRFRYTDSIAVYSAFQEPFVAWAQRTGGAVIELHAYAVAAEDMAPIDQIRVAMIAEMTRMFPELEGAAVLHHEMQLQDDFSRFAPGDWTMRPGTTTSIPNLLLAGDHVKLDVVAHLMEAACVSGRVAANVVLSTEGLREVPIPTVDPKGPLA
ncbi:MAG: FAD-dependent oxidoreductase [Myxococcota bacterium]